MLAHYISAIAVVKWQSLAHSSRRAAIGQLNV